MKESEFSGGSAVKVPDNSAKLARKHSTGFQVKNENWSILFDMIQRKILNYLWGHPQIT